MILDIDRSKTASILFSMLLCVVNLDPVFVSVPVYSVYAILSPVGLAA